MEHFLRRTFGPVDDDRVRSAPEGDAMFANLVEHTRNACNGGNTLTPARTVLTQSVVAVEDSPRNGLGGVFAVRVRREVGHNLPEALALLVPSEAYFS